MASTLLVLIRCQLTDYQALNTVTKKNGCPLPRIQKCLDWLNMSIYLTKIDLISRYWQIWVKKEHISQTAFNTQYGKFEFTVMPYGLINAPAMFQFMMNNIFWPYLNKFAIFYLDNIVIYFKTKEEHLEHIEKTFKALSNYQLYAKLSKCIIGIKNVKFRKYVVGNSTIKPVALKVKIIDDWPILKTVYKI